jgi:hypothetical protein
MTASSASMRQSEAGTTRDRASNAELRAEMVNRPHEFCGRQFADSINTGAASRPGYDSPWWSLPVTNPNCTRYDQWLYWLCDCGLTRINWPDRTRSQRELITARCRSSLVARLEEK